MIQELKNKIAGYYIDCSRHNQEYWNGNFRNAKFASFYAINAKEGIDKITTDIIDKRIVYNTDLY